MLKLGEVQQPDIHSVKFDGKLTDEWLTQFCRLNDQNESNKEIMKQMLSSIIPKTCFISLAHQDNVIACGLGVLERDHLGIFDIVTESHYRKRGFGEQLMLNLLQWGKENGAKCSYLQVLLKNAPALKLYSKLGFQEIYRYWYRAKK